MAELRPISVLVANERGVLARVSSLFARRGFNITSLAVGETDDLAFSRITVVVGGDDAVVEQVVKQLSTLVCVHQVRDLSRTQRVERGLALIKVKAHAGNRTELMELAQVFRARVGHVDPQCFIMEVSGQREKIQAFIDVLRPHGILEMVRTGQIVLERQDSLKQTSDINPRPTALSTDGYETDQQGVSQ